MYSASACSSMSPVQPPARRARVVDANAMEPFRAAYRSGFTARRSRTRNSSRVALSHNANANMPRRRDTNPSIPPAALSVKQDFGVSPAAEMGARSCQLRCQRTEIVDRAIENDAQGSVGGRHRLSPGIAEIEDREPPMAKRDARPTLDALAVGSAAGQRLDHVLDRL